jgi:hypothetical protein
MLSFEFKAVKAVPSVLGSIYEEAVLAFLKGNVDVAEIKYVDRKPRNVRNGIRLALKSVVVKDAIKRAGLKAVEVHLVRHVVYMSKIHG